MRPGSAAHRSGRGRNGSSRRISSIPRSSAGVGGSPRIPSRSTWTRICRSSMWIPCWSSRHSDKSSTTRRNIRRRARRSPSPPSETGADAWRWATLTPPDLVILDLGLPDMDGSEVLERLRAWSSVPLIVLSVRSNEAEKVRLLESGADDYVVKPFGMAELLARAHAAMPRHVRVSTGEPVVKVGPLAIALAPRIVTLNGAPVRPTPTEYPSFQALSQ